MAPAAPSSLEEISSSGGAAHLFSFSSAHPPRRALMSALNPRGIVDGADLAHDLIVVDRGGIAFHDHYPPSADRLAAALDVVADLLVRGRPCAQRPSCS